MAQVLDTTQTRPFSAGQTIHKPQVDEYVLIGIYHLQDILGVCVAYIFGQ